MGLIRDKDTQAEERDNLPFETFVLKTVQSDFDSAQRHMRDLHAKMLTYYKQYHNNRYGEARADNEAARHPFLQEQVDQFVSDAMEKLWFKNQPCTVVPVEASDQQDAQAKQELMDWQNDRDRLYSTTKKLAKDAALYGFCVGQTDYTRQTKRMPQVVPITRNVYDPTTGQIAEMTVGEQYEWQDVTIYDGPTTKRVDPLNFFTVPQKQFIDDEYPILIRSAVTIDYLKSKPYIVNLDQIKAGSHGSQDESGSLLQEKREMSGSVGDFTLGDDQVEYVEWQGLLNRTDLYDYLASRPDIDEQQRQQYATTTVDVMGQEVPVFDPDERCWAIVGMVNGSTIVRLEDSPFEFDGPNVVVGTLSNDDDGLLMCSGIADKVYGLSKQLDAQMIGLHRNTEQSTNRMWVVDSSKIKSGGKLLNRPGAIIEAISGTDAIKALDVPRVAPDIYQNLAYFAELGKQATGQTDIALGRGDPQTETLGESQIAASFAQTRLKDYVRSFEETCIQPIFEHRNQINMQFLTAPYVFRIIGLRALQWRQVDPSQIRANVDFVCQGSTRETNRSILIQQMLQLMQQSQQVVAMGLPVRLDLMVAELAEQMNIARDKVEQWLPSIGADQEAVVTTMLQQQMMGQPGVQGAAPGGQLPQPRNQTELAQSVQGRQQTQVGRM